MGWVLRWEPARPVEGAQALSSDLALDSASDISAM